MRRDEMLDYIVQEIERNGFCLIPKLLQTDELKIINAFFEGNKEAFLPAMVGPVNNKQRVESIRGDHTFWVDPSSPPIEFKTAITFLNELKNLLNQKFFFGLKDFECHLASYPAGTFYKKHLDRFESNSSRKISFVFYLNEDWEVGAGGELVLYKKDYEILSEISPLPGSFICFLSEEFPHEVKSATIERRSFTGWMHTKLLY